VINGYAAAAAELIPKFEMVSQENLFAPIMHLLPGKPARLIDIGTGAGAGWFATLGYNVLAVEPVSEFRKTRSAECADPGFEWLDDKMPYLEKTVERRDLFDVIILSAVWHHLDGNQRQTVMPRLRSLMAPDGLLVVSLRNGPGAPERRCYFSDPKELIELARSQNLRLRFQKHAYSQQPKNIAAGVNWTWMVFEA